MSNFNKDRKMKLNPEQTETLLESAKPLMKWLNENCHPGCIINMTSRSVGVSEILAVRITDEFLKD